MEKNKELIKSNQSFAKSVIATVVFGAILSMGLNLVWAWSNPGAVAPAGNIAAPLNTGNSLQTKSGPLTINGTLIAGSSMVLGGVSRNSWPTDNLGNHTATQNLDMGNFNIINAKAGTFGGLLTANAGINTNSLSVTGNTTLNGNVTITGSLGVTGEGEIGLPKVCGNLGDINGDGVITIADAKKIAECVVGYAPCTANPAIPLSKGDTNGDGIVNIVDALYIAQHVVGVRPDFPVC